MENTAPISVLKTFFSFDLGAALLARPTKWKAFEFYYEKMME
ncbi:hypothetical protein ACWF7H_23640 [Peribacillus butanolivorans]